MQLKKPLGTLDEEEQEIIKANVLEGIPLIYCNTKERKKYAKAKK